MTTPNSTSLEDGLPTKLWVKGTSYPVTILWVTETHAEVIVAEGVNFDSNQLAAVILRQFISLPMRVIAQSGQNMVLYFVQKPHASMLDLIDRDLIKAGIDRLCDTLEERAVPTNALADIAARQREATCEEQEIVAAFEEHVRSLGHNRQSSGSEKLIAA
ncbi:hypothetical protein [Erythrobacter sp. F6033]|uniref:hypothetical protein n=1 Tax=Erythrobacter sp. F6033 TaxID=2926401 RepID=UPI001FF36C68|nr:hypothetical protein [Erythrobacter sp. F6033]MCK0127870.1 hypothetical protein [Erythrobacter sp. F6033]